VLRGVLAGVVPVWEMVRGSIFSFEVSITILPPRSDSVSGVRDKIQDRDLELGGIKIYRVEERTQPADEFGLGANRT
jgi:hypothetical protein